MTAAATPAPTPAASAGWLPGWGLWAANYAVARAYQYTVGPFVRQHVNGALHQPPTAPFYPPNTPGYVTREVAQAAVGYWVGTGFARFQLRRAGIANAHVSPLTSTNAMQALDAGAGASGRAAAERALRGMLRRDVLSLGLGTALELGVFATLGPKLEQAVNGAFGHPGRRTVVTDIRGGVPLSVTHQGLEESTRSFARTYANVVVSNVVWRDAGLVVAQGLLRSVGGPAGAVLGALAGTMLTSVVGQAVIWAMGTGFCDLAQRGVRIAKRLAGLQLDTQVEADVVASLGDRFSNNVANVLIPFSTALVNGTPGQFVAGLVPRG